MDKPYSGTEIIEIGIQIEMNGRDFYNAIIPQFADQKIVEVFQHLAGEEEKHITVFQKILDAVENYEPKEGFSEEIFSYIHLLAGQHVFTEENKGKDSGY